MRTDFEIDQSSYTPWCDIADTEDFKLYLNDSFLFSEARRGISFDEEEKLLNQYPDILSIQSQDSIIFGFEYESVN